jgi:hypothetical protein
LLLVGGCSSVKEFVPIHAASSPVRVPNQQRLVSLAVAQAIGNAAREVNLQQYAGLSGRVEVNGVFPHSAADLLEYIASGVEFEMAKVGMRVIPHPTMAPVRYEAIASAPVIIMKEQGADATPQPDVRVVASVDWGGIDFKDHKYVVWSRVGPMLGVAVGLLVTGGIIIGAGQAVGGSTNGTGFRTTADDTVPLVTGIIGGIFMGAGILTPLIGRMIDDGIGHQFTLTGRVRLALHVIPNTAGQRPAQGVGDGESHIVIDTRSDSGYTNMIDVPEPKK